MRTSFKYWMAIILAVSVFSSALVSAQVQIQGPNASADIYSGVVYGPIDETDTLWRIASRYKQNSEFNVYQTMLAIYELNRQAFENNNFNTMVNGATLQLPSDNYIARMDVQKARAKAIADDQAFGRQNSVQSQSAIDEVANGSTTPTVPLVNQEDLSSTKQELQRQLNSINRQQSNQFDEVKSQVSTSIDSVQALLAENRKLYERLDQVNQDIADLRTKVEVDVQTQFDQQLALQQEIIALVKQSEQRQTEQDSQSILTTLMSPMAITILSSIITVGVLVILGLWVLRKPKAATDVQQAAAQIDEPIEIVDDELVIGEADDDEDLLSALSQDGDADDILSADLEDGFDELGVGDSIDDSIEDSVLDDADSMLVPDTDEFDIDEDASSLDSNEPEQTEAKMATVIEENVSFDAEAIDLDADEFENQEIDLSPRSKEPSSEEPVEASADDNVDIQEAAATAPSNMLSGESAQGEVDLPDGSSESIDEDSLQQMEESINEVTEKFDALSEEIMDEFENGTGDETNDKPDLASESEVQEEAELKPEPESQRPEPESQQPEPALAPEPDSFTETETETETETNLAQEPEPESTVAAMAPSETQADTTLDAEALENPSSEDDVDDQELDELLEQFSEAPQDDTPADENPEEIAGALEPQNEELDTTTELADELASELAGGDVDDELDSLLGEIGEDVDDFNIDAIDLQDSDLTDSDALLDEIPSLSEHTETSIPEPEETSGKSEDLNDLPEATKAVDAEVAMDGQTNPDDILSDLPDLDDWLNEANNEEDSLVDSIAADYESELNILADIEGSDFEELLAEIGEEDTDVAGELKALESQISKENKVDELGQAGLDIDTLMKDESLDEEAIEDFVDVDDLLSETEALTPKGDDELALDLDDSLSRMDKNDGIDGEIDGEIDVDSFIDGNDAFSEQASNLDLAQVYIDMDDKDAAKELLEEVVSKGNEKQIEEASQLLNNIQ